MLQQFIEYLMQIRELLSVQLENAEETILKRSLWQLMNNRIFFQHPDLMRLLRVHEVHTYQWMMDDTCCLMMVDEPTQSNPFIHFIIHSLLSLVRM